MSPSRSLFILTLLLSPLFAVAAPTVVVSIQPLHSLVAAVTGSLTTPTLLIPAAQSPHGYHLKPSDAQALQQADLVVWVGDALETALSRSIANLSDRAQRISALQTPGMNLLDARAGGLHRDHSHPGDQPEDGDAHDPHLWLDPGNAAVLVNTVADHLQRLDPAHAAEYRDNAAATIERLQRLDQELTQQLAAVRQQPFLVLHDAFQYFEHHYHLNGLGAITVSPERRPGARRLTEIRTKLRTESDNGTPLCLFTEPQVRLRAVQRVMSGSDVRLGTLDPIGSGIPPGADAYFSMLRRNADALLECLKP